jgi:hypothetical protein
METNDAAKQLHDVDRLRVATLVESKRVPNWATPVMAVATVLYFSLFMFDRDGFAPIGPIVWTAFVIVWVLATRVGHRATGARLPRTRAQRRREILEWLALVVVANLIVAVLAQVSWLLVGIAFAVLGTGFGWQNSRRAA